MPATINRPGSGTSHSALVWHTYFPSLARNIDIFEGPSKPPFSRSHDNDTLPECSKEPAGYITLRLESQWLQESRRLAGHSPFLYIQGQSSSLYASAFLPQIEGSLGASDVYFWAWIEPLHRGCVQPHSGQVSELGFVGALHDTQGGPLNFSSCCMVVAI